MVVCLTRTAQPQAREQFPASLGALCRILRLFSPFLGTVGLRNYLTCSFHYVQMQVMIHVMAIS